MQATAGMSTMVCGAKPQMLSVMLERLQTNLVALTWHG